MKTLVDSSVWVDFLRGAHAGVTARLQRLLDDDGVLMHPAIIGELACGNLRKRAQVLALLNRLPSATLPSHAECMSFLDDHSLAGRGLGWVDIQLLAFARLNDCAFWTVDKRLARSAAFLGLVG